MLAFFHHCHRSGFADISFTTPSQLVGVFSDPKCEEVKDPFNVAFFFPTAKSFVDHHLASSTLKESRKARYCVSKECLPINYFG